jgi:NAD(P)H-flavin reductase
MTPEAFTVTARRRETADTWTLELSGAGHRAFAPGQFNMLYAFGQGEAAISISGGAAGEAGAGGDGLAHTVRAMGPTTQALCRARPGDVLGVRGPFGNGWPVEQAEGADVVVVAGGLGLAPLRPAVRHLLAHRRRYGRVAVLYGSRSPDLLLYAGELGAWAERGDVDVGVTVDAAGRGWHGRVGIVSQLVSRAALDPASTVALVCGPEVMMRHAVGTLRARGVTPARIFLSLERNMQCGIGHCGHCQLGPVLICRDGPVFPFDAIGPWLAIREL